MSRPDPVPADIGHALERAAGRLGPFADALFWYECVGSTNDVASRLAERGAAEGTVVAANQQTAGRGRLGREWASPPGAGLYVSAVLRPHVEAARLITLAAGVAVADGVESATGLHVVLKWPNDVYVGGRKLAGILAEGGEFVILGFGLNVQPAAYPPAVSPRATSLEAELGRSIERGPLLAECLAALASRYAQLAAGRQGDVLDAWRRRAAALWGRTVECDVGRGIAEDIGEDGALLVRTARGVARVISGEVRWT